MEQSRYSLTEEMIKNLKVNGVTVYRCDDNIKVYHPIREMKKKEDAKNTPLVFMTPVIENYEEQHKQKFINCLYELRHVLENPLTKLQSVINLTHEYAINNCMPKCSVTWLRPHTFYVYCDLNYNPKKHIENYDHSCNTFNNTSNKYVCRHHNTNIKYVEMFSIKPTKKELIKRIKNIK